MKNLIYCISFFVLLILSPTFKILAQYGNAKDSLFLELSEVKEDTSKVNILIEIANYYKDSDVKLSGKYASQALEMSKELEYVPGIFSSSYILAEIYTNSSINIAEEHIIRAYEIEKGNLKSENLANVYNQMGIIYYLSKNHEKSYKYLNKNLLISIYRQDSIKIASACNNLAIVFTELNKLDSALFYIFKSVEINTKLNNKLELVKNYGNIAEIYYQKDSIEKGMPYLEKVMLLVEHNNIPTSIKSMFYNQRGEYLINGNRNLEAIEYLNKAYLIAIDRGDLELQNIILINLINVYSNLDKTEKALEYSNKLHQLKDTIAIHQQTKKLDKMEIRFKYEKEQEILVLRHNTKILRMLFIITGIGLLFMVVLLLFLFQRMLVKKNILEREKLELKKNELEQAIALKNRELTSNMMHLVNYNELIERVIKKLANSELHFKQENKKPINNIVSELKIHLKTDLWKSFDIEFMNVHPDFYKNLEKEFENLTSREKRLCALLKMNLSSKEISNITHVEEHSVITARSRLRKKLKLTGKETSLTAFLAGY